MYKCIGNLAAPTLPVSPELRTGTRRRGRTRIWDELITPGSPMRPDRPNGLLESLLAHLFHPVQTMRSQLERGTGWGAAPWKLWATLALIAVAGSMIYGATLALVLPAGGALYAATALTISAGAGWLLFGMVLIAITRKPPPHLAHGCMVAMLFGEGVLELGVVANLLMGLLFHTPPGVALAVNVAVVALSNVAMLGVLAAQLRELGVSIPSLAALWIAILNPAGLAAFRLFYPELFPF